MSSSHEFRGAVCAALGLFLLCPVGCFSAASAAATDATDYTGYYLGTDYQSVTLQVCSIRTETCNQLQTLGPFGRVGAMVEGFPTFDRNRVSRRLYIVDVAAGPSALGVQLVVYNKVDTLTDEGPVTEVSHEKTITLPLVGGSTATAFIAGNHAIVVIGTDQNGSVVGLQKGSWDVVIDLAYGDGAVNSITSDDDGFILARGGDPYGKRNPSFLFSPAGDYVGPGVAATFLLNSTTGISTRGLATIAP